MARLSLVILALIAVAGIVFSMLPSSPPRLVGDVRLQDVSVVLFPDADRDARWTFASDVVTYNPDTRESLVHGASQGYRYVGEKADLILRGRDIVIDANENLRLNRAIVYIPDQCITLVLGKENMPPVYIDQGQGYRAPYATITFPDMRGTGGPLVAPFNLENMELSNAEYQITYRGRDGVGPKCVNGRVVKPAS
jgi:hypothetical protein